MQQHAQEVGQNTFTFILDNVLYCKSLSIILTLDFWKVSSGFSYQGNTIEEITRHLRLSLSFSKLCKMEMPKDPKQYLITVLEHSPKKNQHYQASNIWWYRDRENNTFHWAFNNEYLHCVDALNLGGRRLPYLSFLQIRAFFQLKQRKGTVMVYSVPLGESKVWYALV